jgi:hypothetical protein
VILGRRVSASSVAGAPNLPTACRAVHNPLIAGHALSREHVQLGNALAVRHMFTAAESLRNTHPFGNSQKFVVGHVAADHIRQRRGIDDPEDLALL